MISYGERQWGGKTTQNIYRTMSCLFLPHQSMETGGCGLHGIRALSPAEVVPRPVNVSAMTPCQSTVARNALAMPRTHSSATKKPVQSVSIFWAFLQDSTCIQVSMCGPNSECSVVLCFCRWVPFKSLLRWSQVHQSPRRRSPKWLLEVWKMSHRLQW